LDVLNNIHSDFYGVGYSAVELDNDIVLGRPFGGTCILYRKCLEQRVSTLVTHDPRITAVTFDSNLGLVLMICVYMPTDYGSYDSYSNMLISVLKLLRCMRILMLLMLYCVGILIVNQVVDSIVSILN